uniref:ABC transporter ATP-binding protein n=1 Tax=Aestuariimicrobium ganziense TaxID=2773677 RepID=UPI002E2E325B|nr:ABC transporter ATP-binding protein [Aestuariimicrobium ganziense]
MTDSVIDAQGLHRRFGRVVALDGFDLQVQRGQVHGFLGPNGAGKSTTIRILLGLLRAHGGHVRVLGADPWHDAVSLHRRMAYVPGDVSLWPSLSGGECIDVLSRLRGGVDPTRRAELVEAFELDPTKKAGTYSKGNRQKVALVAALASEAELLVLDEPTSGLDPLMESVFAGCIEHERQQGRTVLLSSHTLAQVERLCDQISIIRAGRLVESGSLAELRHLTRSSVRVRTRDAFDPTGLAGVHDPRQDDPTHDDRAWSFSVDAEHLDEVVGRAHGAGIVELVTQPPSLEDLFLRHYVADAGSGARR